MRIPEKVCECGYKMSGTSSIEGQDIVPPAGSFSICLNCGKLYIFNADKTQREATIEENIQFSKLPDAKKIIKVRQLYEEYKRRNSHSKKGSV